MPKLNPPVIAWGISSAGGYPEEAALVASALARVRNNNWQFWLFGVKRENGNLPLIASLKDRGVPCQVFQPLPYDEFLNVLEEASIGLAPLVPSASAFSAGKSFGKVLAYLDCRVSIVASNCAEHPMFFRHGKNGFLASNAAEFAECIDLLLSDGDLRTRVTELAHHDYVDKLSIGSVAREMDTLLRPLVTN
jgi:glycosyltransferase involved in cell wall biosynthesis